MRDSRVREKRRLDVDTVDHIGIRVSDIEQALDFYAILGFDVDYWVTYDDVIIIRTASGLEINLITNADQPNDGVNILIDVPQKYPGCTHIALRVSSIRETMEILRENDITITQGPVVFGREGWVSVFVRDPDRNVIELSGRDEDTKTLEGVTFYNPNA